MQRDIVPHALGLHIVRLNLRASITRVKASLHKSGRRSLDTAADMTDRTAAIGQESGHALSTCGVI